MTDSPPRPRGHRFAFLVTVAILAVGAIIAIRMQPEMESNFKGILTVLTVLVTLLLTLIWFLFLSRLSALTRVFGFLLIAGLIAGLKFSTRVDGSVDGSGAPKIVWKWTPKAETPAAPLPKAAPASLPAHTDIPDVPQFFGPDRDGIVRSYSRRLSLNWDAHPPKQLWRQPVGLGWAAFSVAGGRAFTLEQRGEDELVTCYDVVTGALIWSHVHAKTRFTEWQGGDGPRSTPTVSNGKVFAMGATGILDCLNASDGTQVWSRNILTENKLANLMWAKSTSPLVFDDKVVVTGGDYGKDQHGVCVFAYHRDTGAPLWKAGDDNSSYASPVLTTLAGVRLILSSNANNLSAHDPATGKVLFQYAWGVPNWPRAAQPAVIPGDRVFLSAGYGNGCVMIKVQPGANGQLAATELWHNNKMKTQFNSVHVFGGYLYGLDDGSLACINIETGDRVWKDGRFGSGQTLGVTIAPAGEKGATDDVVLIQSEKGDVVLASAQPQAYHELGRIPALSSKTWNHPVLAGRYLLVRNDQEMACYELPVAP